MYLAEGEFWGLHVLKKAADAELDRILCWELVSKRGCKWKLHYVKSAYAITDVPDTVGLVAPSHPQADRSTRFRSWSHNEEGRVYDSGRGAGLIAWQMAERVVLRGDTLHSSLWLSLPLLVSVCSICKYPC